MRQRIKARELWLFAPILLIMAGAFYWARVEKVSKPGGDEMYVSEVKVEAAPGYWQEQGYSHDIKVVASHPWPRPKWWGEEVSGYIDLLPVNFDNPGFIPKDSANNRWNQGGGALFIRRNGEEVEWQPKGFDIDFSCTFDGTNYVFAHSIKQSELFSQPGEIVFRGVYRIVDGETLSVERVIRKAGQTLPPMPTPTPGAQLIKIVVKPFMSSTGTNQRGVRVGEQLAKVHLFFRRQNGKSHDATKPGPRIYDVEVVDEKGKVYPSDQKGNFRFQGVAWSVAEDEIRKQLSGGEDVASLSVFLSPLFKSRHELTVRGKISVDEGWPLRFETKLEPGETAKK